MENFTYTYAFEFQSFFGKPDIASLTCYQKDSSSTIAAYNCVGEQAIAYFKSLLSTGTDEFNRQQHLEILFKKLKADSEGNLQALETK